MVRNSATDICSKSVIIQERPNPAAACWPRGISFWLPPPRPGRPAEISPCDVSSNRCHRYTAPCEAPPLIPDFDRFIGQCFREPIKVRPHARHVLLLHVAAPPLPSVGQLVKRDGRRVRRSHVRFATELCNGKAQLFQRSARVSYILIFCTGPLARRRGRLNGRSRRTS